MGTDGKLTYHGDNFIIYVIIKSLCSTPETNIILHINYTSIYKREST